MRNKLRVATVFSGIGAPEQALKRLNIDFETVFACDNGEVEIDYDLERERAIVEKLSGPVEKKRYVDNLYALKTRRTNFVKISYLANYKMNEDYYFQDIRLLDGKDFQGKVDLLVGGSPCQSFSTVGFQGGLDDTRGTLFYDYANLIKDIKPKVFIYENVRGLYTHDKGKTWTIIKSVFKELGYDFKYDVLNAADYGIPQTRRRLFVVGIRKDINLIKSLHFPPDPIELKYSDMHDFLLSNVKLGNFYSIDGRIHIKKEPGYVDPKYILTPKLKAYVMKEGTKSFHQKVEIDKPIARTILKTMGNRHRAGIDNYVTDIGPIRMLTEREALRLMGFPDDFKQVVSRAQGYKQAGNSIVVDVLIAIYKEIFKTGVFDN